MSSHLSPLPALIDPQAVEAPLARQYLQAVCGQPLAGLVKLRTEDWARVPAGPTLLHLNAAPCTNEVGGVYAMARISAVGAPGRAPQMDVSDWRLLVCRGMVVLPGLELVHPSLLPLLVGQPATIAELAALMHNRYAGLRHEWETPHGGQVVLCTFEVLG